MAASPKWKVYTENNEYVASFKFFVDAQKFLFIDNWYGDGATIREGHKKSTIRWTKGEVC